MRLAPPPIESGVEPGAGPAAIQGFNQQGLRVRYSRVVASLGRLTPANPSRTAIFQAVWCCIPYYFAMRSGDVVWNPLTGEKSLLIESAEETSGARIVADFA